MAANQRQNFFIYPEFLLNFSRGCFLSWRIRLATNYLNISRLNYLNKIGAGIKKKKKKRRRRTGEKIIKSLKKIWRSITPTPAVVYL
jgi:hypothetical protein